jgi:hypothetical protein
MSWTVEYDPELKIIDCHYIGRVTDDDFKEATAKAIGLAKTNNTNRFLIDDSDWQGGASVLGLFELQEIHEELEADRASRAAIVLPSPDRSAEVENVHFYETVCRNRGWNVRLFPKREKAIKWLTIK